MKNLNPIRAIVALNNSKDPVKANIGGALIAIIVCSPLAVIGWFWG